MMTTVNSFTCLIGDLKPGQQFRFARNPESVWEYRGNLWYGWPYSGGPYRVQLPRDCEVIPLRPLEYLPLPEEYNA